MTIAFVRLAAAGLILIPSAAQADELQTRVLQAIRTTQRDGYSFQRTLTFERTGAPRKTVVERYDPRRPASQRWSLLSVDGHAPTSKDIAQSAKMKRGPTPSYGELAEWFGAPATRSDGTPGYAVYRFDRLPAGTVKIGSHDASADTRAEAVVNLPGRTPFVERVRFTSTTGFRMMLVASVESIDLLSRYARLPHGGVVPLASSSMLQGSMLGKSGKLTTTIAFQDMQPVR